MFSASYEDDDDDDGGGEDRGPAFILVFCLSVCLLVDQFVPRGGYNSPPIEPFLPLYLLRESSVCVFSKYERMYAPIASR